MTVETIAKALGGRKARSGWIARCPAHDDRKPSLSIGETKDRRADLTISAVMIMAPHSSRLAGGRR